MSAQNRDVYQMALSIGPTLPKTLKLSKKEKKREKRKTAFGTV